MTKYFSIYSLSPFKGLVKSSLLLNNVSAFVKLFPVFNENG
jgi:hypothetical protein